MLSRVVLRGSRKPPFLRTVLATTDTIRSSNSPSAVCCCSQSRLELLWQPLVPDAIKPVSAGFTLTVNGTGFVSGAVVKWNGNARTTTFVSKSRLTATILSTDVAKANTASVTVANPTPGGGKSNVVFFPIRAAVIWAAFSPAAHFAARGQDLSLW